MSVTITSKMVGPDGRVSVWDRHTKQHRRLFPVDAVEFLRNPADGRLEPPLVEIANPQNPKDTRVMREDVVAKFLEQGWKITRSDLSEDEVVQAATAGAEVPTENTTDFGRFTVDELREFGHRAGIQGVEQLKKGQLMDQLKKVNFRP